jgi:hypothetical protein
VDCSKLARTLPAFQPQWTVQRGIEELYAAYKRYDLRLDEFLGTRYLRIKHITAMQSQARLDAALRWQQDPPPANGGGKNV